VTEAEWLTCADPNPMLGFIEVKASKRKMRLFACACCRRIWRLLVDERSQKAVEVAERYADGLADHRELHEATVKAEQAFYKASRFFGQGTLVDDLSPQSAYFAADLCLCAGDAADAVTESVACEMAGDDDNTLAWKAAKRSEEVCQAALLREIVGNPFHLVSVDPSWLTSAVTALARGIYEERAFDRLPVLADALEEAGCANADLLSHCRGPRPHVRGCWVVDLILGKE
jgi:hypothetical protein